MLLLFLALPPHSLQLPLQLRILIIAVVAIVAIIIIVLFFVVIVRINVSRLLQYSPPLRVYIFFSVIISVAACGQSSLRSSIAGRGLVAVLFDGERRAVALLLGVMGGLSGEQLGSKIVRVVFVVGVTALARAAVLELGVCGEKALMVGRATEGVLAAGLHEVEGLELAVLVEAVGKQVLPDQT